MIDTIERQGGEVSTVTQLSRPGAPEAVEHHLGSVLISLMPNVAELEPELVHVARNGSKQDRRDILDFTRKMRSN